MPPNHHCVNYRFRHSQVVWRILFVGLDVLPCSVLLMFFCGLQFCKSNKTLLTKDLSLFLLKHNHITSTSNFICTFKHTKRCSLWLKISCLAWEIFRFAQCLEWLLDQRSYLSAVIFLQRKSRRGLKLKTAALYIASKLRMHIATSPLFSLSSWHDSSAQGEFMLPFLLNRVSLLDKPLEIS
jgi:hypothetical protein